MSDTILSGNFTIYYLDENRQKRIEWSGSDININTMNELYSALQDHFDESLQMDDGVPMSAQTPVEYSIGIIGTHEVFMFDGCMDFRNIPIKDTVALMNRSKLVIGQSSGPLHLASLSGAKHFVWSEEYNRIRYEQHWNPHKTSIYFYGKGGHHALRVFNRLTEIFPQIKCVVVSDVPAEFKKEYMSNKRIKIYDIMPQEKLFKLFEKASIFPPNWDKCFKSVPEKLLSCCVYWLY